MKSTLLDAYKKISITLPVSLLAHLDKRAGQARGGSNRGARSFVIADTLQEFYELTARAERTVRGLLTREEIALCRQALHSTFVEASLIPHLREEIAQGLEAPAPALAAKLDQLGLLELYALAQMTGSPCPPDTPAL